MDLDFSFSQIMAGILFGIVGMYLLRLSKKRPNFPFMLIGIALIVYPYFVSSDWLTWIVGLVLVGQHHLLTISSPIEIDLLLLGRYRG